MMDILTTFGLFAVSAMLVCYALEDYSPWFVLAFAGACLRSARPMVFCKALGRSALWKLSGPLSPYGAGILCNKRGQAKCRERGFELVEVAATCWKPGDRRATYSPRSDHICNCACGLRVWVAILARHNHERAC